MHQHRRRFAIAAGLTIALAGCGVSPNTTLQELLTTSGLGSVTVGDVLNAVEQFAGNAGLLPFGGTLTADQQTQLTDLRSQLDAGTITQSDFEQQAAAIVGVQAAGMPFGAGPGREFGGAGFPGGPMGHHGGPDGPGGRHPGPGGHPGRGQDGLAAQLNLTDDQKTQAQAIFDAMRQDILKLQQDAKTPIDALLTDAQRQQLDSLKGGHAGGFRFFGYHVNLDRLAERLGLSADQKTQIQTILDTLHTAVDARRQTARDAFRAILTADQQTIFDQFLADHPPKSDVKDNNTAAQG